MNIYQAFKIELTKLKSWRACIKIDLTLVKSWIPLLKLLNFLGNAPIQIKPTKIQMVSEFPADAVKQELYEFKMRWFTPGLIFFMAWPSIRLLYTLGIYFPSTFPDIYQPRMSL